MLRNLWTAFRLALLLPPVDTKDVRNTDGALWFSIFVHFLCCVFYSWLYLYGSFGGFGWYGILPFGYLVGLIFLGLFLLGLLLRPAPPEQARKIVILLLNVHIWTSLFSNVVFYVLVYKLHANIDQNWNIYIALWQFMVFYKAVLGESAGAGLRELLGAALFSCLFYFAFQYFEQPEFINAKINPQTSQMLNAEEALGSQPGNLDEAFAAIKPSKPGQRDNYLIALAPNGYQDVFRKEALFAQKAFDAHDGTAGRSLVMSNTVKTIDSLPLATVTNLRDALQRLGRIIQPQEDALILYLTSHGGEDATLETYLSGISLIGFNVDELHNALAESPFKWKIVIISACYAGSFIPKLKDDNTLIITAAAADRNSFGCSDENDLTFFGDAFLKQALPKSRSWDEAYSKAAAYVTEREKAGGEKPSLPQIYVGKNIGEYLRKKNR